MITPRGIKNIENARDVNFAKEAGNDTKALVYDHATAKFIAANNQASPGGSDTYVQYNDGGAFGGDAGLTYSESTDALTIAGSVIVPAIKPASDSGAAVQIQDAAGATSIVTIDTVNKILYASRGTSTTNIFIGDAGNTTLTGTYNTCINFQSGASLTTGAYNNNFGYRAGWQLTTGDFNNNYGRDAGYFMTEGRFNNNFGYRAGYNGTTGDYNNNFGRESGYSLTEGNNHTNVGREAGYSATTVDANVCIGYQAGKTETSGDRLHIANVDTKSLLLGDFANNRLAVGYTDLTVPSYALDVSGDVHATTSVITPAIKPASDSTSAIEIQDASGNNIATVDSTNRHVYFDKGTAQSNLFIGGGGNTTTTGTQNFGIGNDSLSSLTTGIGNVSVGHAAGTNITSGLYNNSFGRDAGYNITDGIHNNNFGYQSGYTLTSGDYNNNFGISTGFSLTNGSYNNNFGRNAGYSLTTGTYNNNFGRDAGYSQTSAAYNNNFGYNAGYSLTTGTYNNNFGRDAGYSVTDGIHNNNFGYRSGYTLDGGDYNNNFGLLSGFSLTSGSDNQNFGRSAGYSLTTGDNNTNIGREAGYSATTANDNVNIGFKAGYSETASDRLHIANTDTKSLLLGDFANNQLAIGGTALETPTATLDVIGDTIRLRNSKTPASASDTGNQGDLAWDSSYLYVCTATDTWKRASLATW